MKKYYISIVLSVFMAMTPAFASSGFFTDLADHWGAYELLALYEMGIVKGYSDTLMMPNATYTNAQAIVMVTRAVKKDPVSGEGAWYEPAYRYALEANWMAPLTQGELHAPITREGLLELLYKVYQSFESSPVASKETSVIWAIDSGLLVGKPGGVLDLESHLTRAEGGVLMYRFIQTFSDQINVPTEGADVTYSIRPLEGDQAELTLFWGEKPTGGYQIAIKEVVFKNGKTVVYFSTRSPGPDEMVTQAITYPKDFLLVSKEDVSDADIELVLIPW